jgi:predicted metal-dependent peptidase
VSGHSSRAARALAHLGEVDPALGVLALWCRHRDGEGATATRGETISYGPGFDTLPLPEQVGLVAHHVLHVALRHSERQAGLAARLGEGFDPSLYGLAADGIINEVLILAGHAVPRPAVVLTALLAEAGMPAISAVAALERWDADRLAMALHADPSRAEKLRDWGATRGFAIDLEMGEPDESGETQKTADWRNQILRALEAGRRAGSGIGRLGAILADLAPPSVPWEVQLRGLLARALTERPHLSWRRPAGAWLAQMSQAATRGGLEPAFQPGRARMDRRPRLVVGLDTSSSIDAQAVRLFLAEAEGIARRTGAEVHLMGFDTEVFVARRLGPLGWQGAQDLDLRRGGGTDYADLFAKAGRISPALLVVLSDLDASLPPAPGFPVLWAVPRAVAAPPFGRVLVIGAG